MDNLTFEEKERIKEFRLSKPDLTTEEKAFLEVGKIQDKVDAKEIDLIFNQPFMVLLTEWRLLQDRVQSEFEQEVDELAITKAQKISEGWDKVAAKLESVLAGLKTEHSAALKSKDVYIKKILNKPPTTTICDNLMRRLEEER